MAFQFPWTNLHELNLDWFLSKFKQFTNNYLETTATAESVPYNTPPSVTVTGGELDDDTDIVDPFTFNFKIPAGQPGAQGAQGVPGAPGQDGFSPIATVTKSGTVATITITDVNGTTSTTISDGEVTQAQLDTKAPAILPTVSGSIANFSDGADDMPLTSLVANIDSVQDLSNGDPSPTNICPITGWTGVNVYNDPKYGGTITFNQLVDTLPTSSADGITTQYDGATNEIVITNNSRTANYSTGSTRGIIVADAFLVLGHKYFVETSPHITGVGFFSGNTFYSPGAIYTHNSSSNSLYFRVTRDYDFVTDHPIGSVSRLKANVFDLTLMFGAGNEPTATAFKALFPHDYYAYNVGVETLVSAVNGDPYTHISILWQTEAGTVYGGSLDVATGSLTVTDGYIASYNGETLPSTWISDRDVYAPGTTPTTGAEVVYKLATPQTYQLTPQQLFNTLYGVNNVWCDTGDSTVTYTADTKLYIEQLTQPAEDDMVANTSIANGKFFMIGNNLYRATTTIASGSQIIPGTNATALSLADALNLL